MRTTTVIASIATAFVLLAPIGGAVDWEHPPAFSPDPNTDKATWALKACDRNPGEVELFEEFPETAEIVRAVHVLCKASDEAKPGGGGGGQDCTSTAYRLAGWHWTSSYRATSASYASLVGQGLGTWDAQTGASISAGSGSGKQGEAGTYDGVNQIEWESLGASSTIAVTTTWYYRGSGVAVESDGQYNTYYQWSTSGEAGKMDVLNIVTHEVGHTFGLNHPSGSGISCLTMYAYGAYGETQKRTLGAGDILGIEAIYGA
jgi:hypothetical protein